MFLFSFFSLLRKAPPLSKHYKSASGAVSVQLYFQALLKHLVALRAFNLTT